MDYRYRDILLNDSQLGPYPLEKLKRVDTPTTEYVSGIKPRYSSDSAMAKVLASDRGKALLAAQGGMFFERDPLCSELSSLQNHIAQYTLPDISKTKGPLPEYPRILSRHIKSLGYFLGADMVAVCKPPKSALYLEVIEKSGEDAFYENAIVLLNKKKTDVIRQSYGREWIDDPCSFQTYQRCACQAQVMTGYLRRLGWRSDSSIVGKYTTLIPQLIIESGLGEESRLGIPLNPFVGAAFKASVVLTDLPMEVDKPIDFGLQDYCAKCAICAEQCPTQAISYGNKTEYNGYMKWDTDHTKCALGVLSNKVGNICQRCTKVCPWNRRDNQPVDFNTWDGSIEALRDSVDRQAKRLRDNNFVEPEELNEKWWFPLVREDGKIVEGREYDYSKLI
jgi:ferredoxin